MGNLLYTSGHLPLLPDGSLLRGKVGVDLDADAGKAAARQVACAILATLENALGSVDRVKRVVKVLGMVNCTPDFTKQPHVLNGCSELFAEIWGADAGNGRARRSDHNALDRAASHSALCDQAVFQNLKH
jgi:enamine deaminase RidA (YjgF/YER057c/UK114 family)